ncbi:hypothetical protein AB0D27_09105 [Streptomyces sp. NPDC048415]|uniref:hypothetical protein n=1 Tax=Streptomyces sp. NPDC048415 TaxID=3154822 RepID=UPI0034419258
MTSAQHLATIERLCSEGFPQEHGGSDVGAEGPGYRIVELATSEEFWEDDGTAREETQEQYEADRDGITELLANRWGRPHIISLASVFERSVDGEDIPEPWGILSSHVPDLHLWRADGHDRWVALGVSQWARDLPFQLLLVVTEIDPP